MTNFKVDTLITEKQAALVLGISVAWLQRRRWMGSGPRYVKHGRAVRYEPAELERWIAANRVNTTR